MTMLSFAILTFKNFMLSIRNLCYHPPATPEAILNNISFELQDRQLGLMVGPSGSGKSTLLEILAGFVEWNSGSIQAIILVSDRIGGSRIGKQKRTV